MNKIERLKNAVIEASVTADAAAYAADTAYDTYVIALAAADDAYAVYISAADAADAAVADANTIFE